MGYLTGFTVGLLGGGYLTCWLFSPVVLWIVMYLTDSVSLMGCSVTGFLTGLIDRLSVILYLTT